VTDPNPGAIAVVAAVERLLSEHGPMSEEQLHGALADCGVRLGDDPDATLSDVLTEEANLVMPLVDGRWVSLPALLAGRVFTHRLDERELQHDLLTLNPDLVPVSMLTEDAAYRRLADGSPLVDVMVPFDADLLDEREIPFDAVDEHGALLLAPGRLAGLGLAAGDLVGVRLTPGGLELEVVEERLVVPDPADVGRRLSAILADRPDEPQQLDLAVWTACADDPALFGQASPPLGQLLEEYGLAQEGDWVAAGGFDFGGWRVTHRIGSIAERYDLSEDEALAVLVTVGMFNQVAGLYTAALEAQQRGDTAGLTDLFAELATAAPDGWATTGDNRPAGERGPGERPLVRATLEFLTEPAVARAVLEETHTTEGVGAAALGLFAETLEPQAPFAARPALRWLRAKAYERLDDDVVQAEAAYRRAEALDPAWPLTLLDLARYASDRGDAALGLSLLRRAGASPEHELIELLEDFRATSRADLGRNQPCWCGTGRKYKHCHLHREQLPLSERAAWLYQKAGMFLLDGPWRDALLAAAAERSRFSDTPGGLFDALDDSLVTDSVLFEGGAFEGFVAVRGALLPDDERLLAAQWLLAERSVHEVEAVRPGQGMRVRDLRTGDVHEVRERTASRQLTAGALVCARVVPAGDTMQIFGGIEPVALHQRDELIALLDTEPDPNELVAFLSRRFAPPALQNTEGEPLVLCDATLRVPDPGALAESLDAAYDREDAGPSHSDGAPSRWLELVTTDGMQRIRATLRLSGDELHVHANSQTRFERVLDAVRTLVPSATVLSEARQPARDMREAARLAESSPARTPGVGGILDPGDPDVATVVGQFIHGYEQKWLDEPIPALGGHTPRECAGDPTRRPDLVRLLDSFPPDSGRGMAMDPDRLRAALDLS
jgi:hypothetical protein